ncbi:MerR family transcriptional regulator [Pelagovum pacificum]|uniref:MerR family transcriptional regulator n=1 Tax=Pelagovum pacificum TaxID=2588711 RepID=A0A5C5GCL3_9RHOB|nr:MerR family transcriptional regulator [Pelagovum pacificum]QQA44348.1 MerR family transcriptional regulator [Pelagovum pacificum]TNY32535.1 MerR family transcriptional regulator [Pelagovum pacificum]
MNKSPDAFRTISEVAEKLDTPAHVLRFWESKFPQVKPVKRAGGRRYYRPDDVALLGGIKALLHDDGMTIKGVQKLLREKGIRHVAGMADPASGPQEGLFDGEATDAVDATSAPEPETETEAAAEQVAEETPSNVVPLPRNELPAFLRRTGGIGQSEDTPDADTDAKPDTPDADAPMAEDQSQADELPVEDPPAEDPPALAPPVAAEDTPEDPLVEAAEAPVEEPVVPDEPAQPPEAEPEPEPVQGPLAIALSTIADDPDEVAATGPGLLSLVATVSRPKDAAAALVRLEQLQLARA